MRADGQAERSRSHIDRRGVVVKGKGTVNSRRAGPAGFPECTLVVDACWLKRAQLKADVRLHVVKAVVIECAERSQELCRNIEANGTAGVRNRSRIVQYGSQYH